MTKEDYKIHLENNITKNIQKIQLKQNQKYQSKCQKDSKKIRNR